MHSWNYKKIKYLNENDKKKHKYSNIKLKQKLSNGYKPNIQT